MSHIWIFSLLMFVHIESFVFKYYVICLPRIHCVIYVTYRIYFTSSFLFCLSWSDPIEQCPRPIAEAQQRWQPSCNGKSQARWLAMKSGPIRTDNQAQLLGLQSSPVRGPTTWSPKQPSEAPTRIHPFTRFQLAFSPCMTFSNCYCIVRSHLFFFTFG